MNDLNRKAAELIGLHEVALNNDAVFYIEILPDTMQTITRYNDFLCASRGYTEARLKQRLESDTNIIASFGLPREEAERLAIEQQKELLAETLAHAITLAIADRNFVTVNNAGKISVSFKGDLQAAYNVTFRENWTDTSETDGARLNKMQIPVGVCNASMPLEQKLHLLDELSRVEVRVPQQIAIYIRSLLEIGGSVETDADGFRPSGLYSNQAGMSKPVSSRRVRKSKAAF